MTNSTEQTCTTTKRYGLIGDPIYGSMSPTLFAAAYGGEYRYDLIPGSDFNKSFQTFKEKYAAVNVTAPFKEKALAAATCADPACKKIGAANILVKKQENIVAYNSDYTGIIRSISPHLTNKAQYTALIIGCGGAGKAAAVACGDMGIKTTLMNRTFEKAEIIAKRLSEYKFSVQPISDIAECFSKSDIIIYTLPEPADRIDEIAHIRPTSCSPKIILEANYKNPTFNKSLLNKISDIYPNTNYIPGIVWLMHQTAGYYIMTGKEPDCQAIENSIQSYNRNLFH